MVNIPFNKSTAILSTKKNKGLRFLVLITLSLFSTLLACNSAKEEQKHIWIDFNDTITLNKKVQTDSVPVIRVAIASIISPQETFIQYNNILNYIEKKLNRKIILVQKKTYLEVNNLLKKNEIDLAFICSGAYVIGTADSAFNLLVIPEIKGKHYYRAYLIVHKGSKIKTFNGLRNKKFVFSDSLSNTGMFYPLKRLNDLNSSKDNFFSATYISNAHDYSIELVSRRIVDGASVNGLIYDYQAIFTPEKIKDTKVIEESDWFGMPPVVVSKGIDSLLKNDLETLLINMHNDDEGKEILKSLLIDRYVLESDTIYNGIRKMCYYISSSR